MSYLPDMPLAVLLRLETAEVEAVTIHSDEDELTYETVLETKLGERLILVTDLPPQNLSGKTMEQFMSAGVCHDAVVTRKEGRGRDIGSQWTLRLRLEEMEEEPVEGASPKGLRGAQVTVDHSGSTIVITLTSVLDIETASKLESAIRKAWVEAGTLILEFKRVNKIVGTALRVLTELFARLLSQSKPRLVLVGKCEKLRVALDRAGLLGAFRVCDSLKEAGNAFRPTIAIFETDPTIRDQLIKDGEDLGVRVVARPGGAAVLQVIEDEKPNLVMLGLVLEDVDSLLLVRQLRQKLESESLPIAILADDKRGETVRACIEAGCTDYLLKPISRESLVRALEKAGVAIQ